MVATISHFSSSAMLPFSVCSSAVQLLSRPLTSLSHICSVTKPASFAVSKNEARFARPVWKPAMTHTRALGSSDRKWSMDVMRFSCSSESQRQSADTILVNRWAWVLERRSVKTPHLCPSTAIFLFRSAEMFFLMLISMFASISELG